MFRFIYDSEQVLPILVLQHRLGDLSELLRGDPAVAAGDLLQAGDLEALALLDGLDVDRGVGKGVVGAGVEPGEAAAEGLDLEFAVGEEPLVDGRDLQFAAGGGLDALGDLHDLVGVEVEARDGVVALWLGRLLFDAEAVAIFVKLGHTVALRVADPVAEDGGLAFFFGGAHRLQQEIGEAHAVENVVAKDQAGAVVSDELLPDEEGLREAVGAGLLGVGEADAVVGAVAQQAPEGRQVLRGADDKNIPDSRQHQRADGVVHHRLVIDGEELLAHPLGDRVQAGAGASGEDNSFHGWRCPIRSGMTLVLVPFEYISCVHLALDVVQDGVVAVGDDGVGLGLEGGEVVDDAGAEEGGAVFEDRFVDDDLGALGLDALHNALDGGLAEVVGARLHREAVDADHDLLLLRGRVGVDAGVAVVAGAVEDAVRDEVLAGAVGVHDGLDEVLRDVVEVRQELLGVLRQAVAAVAEGGVVVVVADAGVEADALDDGLGVKAFHFGVGLEFVEVRYAEGQVGVGEEFYCLCFRAPHK